MYRLTIRAEIISEEASQTDTPHSHKRALALAGGGLVVLLALGWVGISIFRTDAPAASTRDSRFETSNSRLDRTVEPEATTSAVTPSVAPVVSVAAPQLGPGTPSDERASVEANVAKSVQASASTRPDPSPSTIQEVIPNASHNALQTIRGTVRVSVRVAIDKHGAVVAATSHDPGPSRYFERISLEASRKWTFAPTDTTGRREMLLRFNFTREGVTAHATPVS